MSDWPDDYNLLGLRWSYIPLITNVNVSLWGNEVLFECIYDPEENDCLIAWHFIDCRDISWEVLHR
jgi:hypothetical protein